MSAVPYTTGMPPAVAGDVGDYRDFRLSGVDSLLTASAMSADVWLEGEAKTTLTTTVINPARRTVRVELGGPAGWLATAPAGDYNFEITIQFGPNRKLTWPARQPAILGVRPQV